MSWPKMAHILHSFGVTWVGIWEFGGRGVKPPHVHVYRRPFLSENRFKISIPAQNFKHFDFWPSVLLGQFQHWVSHFCTHSLMLLPFTAIVHSAGLCIIPHQHMAAAAAVSVVCLSVCLSVCHVTCRDASSSSVTRFAQIAYSNYVQMLGDGWGGCSCCCMAAPSSLLKPISKYIMAKLSTCRCYS